MAAFAVLLTAAPAPAKKPPAPPPAVNDEQLYQSAMQCKVRVEALAVLPIKKRDRKRVAAVLAFWVEHERAAGAKLGKDDMEMLKDEVLFGLAEADRPDSFRLANLCLQAPSMGGFGRP